MRGSAGLLNNPSSILEDLRAKLTLLTLLFDGVGGVKDDLDDAEMIGGVMDTLSTLPLSPDPEDKLNLLLTAPITRLSFLVGAAEGRF